MMTIMVMMMLYLFVRVCVDHPISIMTNRLANESIHVCRTVAHSSDQCQFGELSDANRREEKKNYTRTRTQIILEPNNGRDRDYVNRFLCYQIFLL